MDALKRLQRELFATSTSLDDRLAALEPEEDDLALNQSLARGIGPGTDLSSLHSARARHSDFRSKGAAHVFEHATVQGLLSFTGMAGWTQVSSHSLGDAMA